MAQGAPTLGHLEPCVGHLEPVHYKCFYLFFNHSFCDISLPILLKCLFTKITLWDVFIKNIIQVYIGLTMKVQFGLLTLGLSHCVFKSTRLTFTNKAAAGICWKVRLLYWDFMTAGHFEPGSKCLTTRWLKVPHIDIFTSNTCNLSMIWQKRPIVFYYCGGWMFASSHRVASGYST